ncbi:MAG: ornithine cyclodeaminase family protein [Sulfitobacter sp.]|nr:ornithine cyclodeaminase family protein [Sulfitobacter sp.]
MTIPFLSEADLEALNITAGQITDMMAHVIRGAAKKSVQAAPKSVLLPPDGRYIMATLAAMDDPALVATKSLVLNERNSDRGLPQIDGIVSLLDGETGAPLAILDGKWITGIRTAGLTALAAKHLAREDAKSIAFIGTGLQARTHLGLFEQMFPLERVRIAGRGQANIDRLSDMARGLGLVPEVCETPQAAVEGSDIVITCLTHTAVKEPFLDADRLSPGAFAASVDLGAPWHKEALGTLDILAIDDLEQEATIPDKLANPQDVDGDLSGLVSGTLAGRTDAEQRTAFFFRGHGLGDLALAALAWQMHRAA